MRRARSEVKYPGAGGPLGATWPEEGHCLFQVWAPLVPRMEVRLTFPEERVEPMVREDTGYFRACLAGVAPGALYFYRLDGQKDRPDPASRSQPQGVHGPSQVTDQRFPWTDHGWQGLTLRDYVIYELHVGTFTARGTFEAAIDRLDDLKSLGVTAIELMPVAQFPGHRNWGYDGVDLFAAQNSYGGPQGLKRLVDACHRRNLAVILDVVYNHLGPEGNYLAEFGPYFTDRYRTPWGAALNFDGPDSDEVRRFFIENALYWTNDCHVDALRLDAVQAILDHSPVTFLEELAAAVHANAKKLGRPTILIAESSANDSRLVRAPPRGGRGLDAQWSDDFHHSLHALLTGERGGYYIDYGRVHHLAKAIKEGFVYSGQYSRYRRRRHGTSSKNIPSERLVVFAQNHDQVGNRLLGERLSRLVSFEALKLAAGLLLLSPYVPLLFMGEEYGETAPFPYFISHSEPDLAEAVRQGRRQELAAFQWTGQPPDPQDPAIFQQARLHHRLRRQGHHRLLWDFYHELLLLRKTVPCLVHPAKQNVKVDSFEKARFLRVIRHSLQGQAMTLFNLGPEPCSVSSPADPGGWRKLLDSAEVRWGGPGSNEAEEPASGKRHALALPPHSFILWVSDQGP